MKNCIVIFICLFSLLNVNAENKDEMMRLLAEKLEWENAEELYMDAKQEGQRDAFMHKNRELFNSLKEREIFYYLDLTTTLYDDSEKGVRPTAVRALNLYFIFNGEYTEDEEAHIAERFNYFYKNKWIEKLLIDCFKVDYDIPEFSESPSFLAVIDQELHENPSQKIKKHKESEIEQEELTREKLNYLPWGCAGLLLVGLFTFKFKS